MSLLNKYNLTPKYGYQPFPGELISDFVANNKSKHFDGEHIKIEVIEEIHNQCHTRLSCIKSSRGIIYFLIHRTSGVATQYIYYNIPVVDVKYLIKLITDGKRYFTYSASDGQFLWGKIIEKQQYSVSPKLGLLTSVLIPKLKIEKFSILIHGLPGCGKSAYVAYMATKTNRNIYVLSYEKQTFSQAINELSGLKKIILLIPEIDKLLNEDGSFIDRELEMPFLELLDGSKTPDKSLIMMISNDVAKVRANKILYRPGRIDLEYDFELITKDQIIFIIKTYYPDFTDFDIFNKYIGKVSFAEFKVAVRNNQMYNYPLDAKLEIRADASKFSVPKFNLYL